MSPKETIVALATPPGVGAVSMIRLSGKDCIRIVSSILSGKDLTRQPSHTIHFGNVMDEDEVIDEVLVALFVAPRSFTKEHSVEISCHGSTYIVNRIIRLLVSKGVRLATPGEFTQRAYLNGRFDLAQAEAVADLIASENEAAHLTALRQMRGGVSREIKTLREKLIHFAAMIELELDFSEEDVAFASRTALKQLIQEIDAVLTQLIDSFRLGNAIKNGVPVVIVGKPNAGKSTLLNALLEEEKAIVSDVAGTTRDVIEDVLIMHGVRFRLIDTAGLRKTTHRIEAIGVQRAEQKMEEAALILYLFDLSTQPHVAIMEEEKKLKAYHKPYLLVGNKVDQLKQSPNIEHPDYLSIAAKSGRGLDRLKQMIWEKSEMDSWKSDQSVVTHARHYHGLVHTKKSLHEVLRGLNDKQTNEFLAQDLRHALHYLGEITGEVTTEDLLSDIFSKFCIGK